MSLSLSSAEDIKEDNATKYEKYLGNQTSGRSRQYKCHSGNTTSVTGSRPPAYKADAQDLKDIANYSAVDYIQTNLYYRKTAAPKIVPYNRNDLNHPNDSTADKLHVPTNLQLHHSRTDHSSSSSSSGSSNSSRSYDSKALFVELPLIRPQLFLATADAVLLGDALTQARASSQTGTGLQQPLPPQAGIDLQRRKNVVVINLSNQRLTLPCYYSYDVGLKDCRTLSHHNFWLRVKAVIELVDRHPVDQSSSAVTKGSTAQWL